MHSGFRGLLNKYRFSLQNAVSVSNRNRNFGLVFVWGEILFTYMIFAYHMTSSVSRTSRKMKKRTKKISKAIDKATPTLIEIL